MSQGQSSGGGNSQKTVIAVAPAGVQRRNRGLLTLLSGTEVGRVHVVEPAQPVKLGRADECTLRFDDTSLSRLHATVTAIAGGFVFTDNGSTNGSTVNGTNVGKGVTLRDGDRIQMGRGTTLRFTLVDDEEVAAMRRLFDAGRKDGLTGLSNRKHFDERLDAEWAFALRHRTALSVILMDVDFFKKVNDGFGHPAGDAVLKHVATKLASGVRAEDLAARYGGEEFVILCRGESLLGACILADRIRISLAAAPVIVDAHSIPVTLSAGVASLACCDKTQDKGSLVALADARLYQAKQAGRNRVVGGA
jgi:diguanylate cyclase (GGDEF)-like protein